MRVRAQRLHYGEEDEHLLRRLGAAVVALWRDLPPETRGLLLQQAVFMADRERPVQLQELLTGFIEARQEDIDRSE